MRLPSGDRLTARRFRQLGMWLGDSAGWELLHHVIELPFGSPAFLYDTEAGSRWGRNPIYATLHESSYADGFPTRWSAARVLPAEVEARGLLHGRARLPVDVGGLRPPAAAPAAAEILAEHAWPKLYDADRLRHNDVPVAATIYVNDLYVERDFAMETAQPDQGPAPVDHERVRAQRPARRR